MIGKRAMIRKMRKRAKISHKKATRAYEFLDRASSFRLTHFKIRKKRRKKPTKLKRVFSVRRAKRYSTKRA